MIEMLMVVGMFVLVALMVVGLIALFTTEKNKRRQRKFREQLAVDRHNSYLYHESLFQEHQESAIKTGTASVKKVDTRKGDDDDDVPLTNMVSPSYLYTTSDSETTYTEPESVRTYSPPVYTPVHESYHSSDHSSSYDSGGSDSGSSDSGSGGGD